MISINSEKIKVVFDKIKENNQDIVDIVLASYDGLSMVSTIKSVSMDEAISVMSAEYISLFDRYKNEIEWETFFSMTIEGLKNHLFLKNIENLGILALVTNDNPDTKVINSNIDYMNNFLQSMKTNK